jgi:hypothetical protein
MAITLQVCSVRTNPSSRAHGRLAGGSRQARLHRCSPSERAKHQIVETTIAASLASATRTAGRLLVRLTGTF